MSAIRVQVSCLAIRDGQVAMIKKINNPQQATYQKLIPPGGHVEYLETIEDACIREMQEETGLVVSNLKLRGTITFLSHYESGTYHSVCYLFVTHAVEGEFALNEPDTLTPHWVPLAGIEGNEDVPAYHRAFIAYLQEQDSFLNARVQWAAQDRSLSFQIIE